LATRHAARPLPQRVERARYTAAHATAARRRAPTSGGLGAASPRSTPGAPVATRVLHAGPWPTGHACVQSPEEPHLAVWRRPGPKKPETARGRISAGSRFRAFPAQLDSWESFSVTPVTEARMRIAGVQPRLSTRG